MRTRAVIAAAGVLVGTLGWIAAPADATTVSVGTEAAYRDALAALSGDGSGPHIIELTHDITITGVDDPVYSGSQDLRINGNGHSIFGGQHRRALDSSSSATVTFDEVVVAGGYSELGPGGGVRAAGPVVVDDSEFEDNFAAVGDGGALATTGPVTVEDSEFTGNVAQAGSGGGVIAGGPVSVSQSIFDSNRGARGGGGVDSADAVTVRQSTFTANKVGETFSVEPTNGGAVRADGVVTSTDSSFVRNHARGDSSRGGGVFSAAGADVTGSTFDRNVAAVGGGLSAPTVSLTNSTLSGNIAERRGGGVAFLSTATLRFATIASNTAPEEAGAGMDGDHEGTLDTYASVLSDPRGGGANCAIGETVSHGFNYDTDGSCALGEGDGEDPGASADPRLGPLQDNGGPTATRAPAARSPLIDGANLDDCTTPGRPDVDQRGVSRPRGQGCDIGAVERLTPSLPTTANVNGSFRPFTGDFDGDGLDDIFWYAPGPAQDHVWKSNGDGSFRGVAISVGGDYQPLAGDWDGDGDDDIVWYATNGGRDFVWEATGLTAFISHPIDVRGSYRPFTGDFNGDGRPEIFWYGPGGKPDRIWSPTDVSLFRGSPVNVIGNYQPVTGDYDADGDDDILWYGPGGGWDTEWESYGVNDFVGHGVTLPDVSRAIGGGDLTADGEADVLLTGANVLLAHHEVGSFTRQALAMPAGSRAFTGLFTPDDQLDMFWYQPGPGPEHLWLFN